MYHTILVPLDGSSRAERIIPHVEEMALKLKSKIIFLQVLSFDDTIFMTDNVHESHVYFHQKKKEADAYLAGFQEDFRKKGIETEYRVEQGDVAGTILTVARSENADLIAIASHGRSGLSRVFYGSVAAGIMHQIDRPLLVVRSRDM